MFENLTKTGYFILLGWKPSLFLLLLDFFFSFVLFIIVFFIIITSTWLQQLLQQRGISSSCASLMAQLITDGPEISSVLLLASVSEEEFKEIVDGLITWEILSRKIIALRLHLMNTQKTTKVSRSAPGQRWSKSRGRWRWRRSLVGLFQGLCALMDFFQFQYRFPLEFTILDSWYRQSWFACQHLFLYYSLPVFILFLRRLFSYWTL